MRGQPSPDRRKPASVGRGPYRSGTTTGLPISLPGLRTAAASGRRTASIVLRWARRGPKRSTKSVSAYSPSSRFSWFSADVVRQVAHERRVNLFEVPERLLAVVEDRFVAGLPAFQLGDLASALFAADLGGLAGKLQLLALNFKALPLQLDRLRLEVHEQVQERDGVVHVGHDRGRSLSRRRYFHPIGPVRRRRVLS